MKSMKNLGKSVAVLLTLAATPAFACSYFIDELAEKNDIIAATASHLRVSLTDIEAVNITAYSWYESISTPMCPKEITHTGVVTISYLDVTTSLHCDATLSVTKKDNWENHQETFAFSGQPNCHR